jgi:hypothetical protein
MVVDPQHSSRTFDRALESATVTVAGETKPAMA